MTREERRELNFPSPVSFLETVHKRRGVESPISGDDLAVHGRFTRIMRNSH